MRLTALILFTGLASLAMPGVGAAQYPGWAHTGVVNILTGFRKELVPTFATHTHLRAIIAAVGADDRRAIRLGAADSVKRVHFIDPDTKWLEDSAQDLFAIRDTLEFKTTWHPIGA